MIEGGLFGVVLLSEGGCFAQCYGSSVEMDGLGYQLGNTVVDVVDISVGGGGIEVNTKRLMDQIGKGFAIVVVVAISKTLDTLHLLLETNQ